MGNIEEREKAKRDYSFKRLFRTFFLLCQKWAIWPGVIRYRLIRWGGVKIGDQCFIGADVTFDTLNPKGISIGKGTTITSGSKIITHYYAPPRKLIIMAM